MSNRAPQKSPKRPAFQGMSSVARTVQRLTKPIFEERGLASVQIVTDWDKIVGPAFAKICTPEKITHTRDERTNGTLHLTAPSAIAPQLQHDVEALKAKINTYFGYAAVGRITIHQRPLKRRSDMMPKAKVVPQAVKAEIEHKVADALKGIEDEELRKTLASFGTSLNEKKWQEGK